MLTYADVFFNSTGMGKERKTIVATMRMRRRRRPKR
jgi:hypothetical protein